MAQRFDNESPRSPLEPGLDSVGHLTSHQTFPHCQGRCAWPSHLPKSLHCRRAREHRKCYAAKYKTADPADRRREGNHQLFLERSAILCPEPVFVGPRDDHPYLSARVTISSTNDCGNTETPSESPPPFGAPALSRSVDAIKPLVRRLTSIACHSS